MRLYMIRHGESVANFHRLHAGWSQTPLSPKGEAEALKTGEILKKYCFDKVYCSDLLRAIQTKELALPNADVILTDKLREINVGELAGKDADECVKQYGKRYLTDKAAHDFRFYGGENREAHNNRMSEFLDTVKKETAENIAVFCHEGTIRCAMRMVNYEKAEEISIDNGGIYIFEYADGMWLFICDETNINSEK